MSNNLQDKKDQCTALLDRFNEKGLDFLIEILPSFENERVLATTSQERLQELEQKDAEEEMEKAALRERQAEYQAEHKLYIEERYKKLRKKAFGRSDKISTETINFNMQHCEMLCEYIWQHHKEMGEVLCTVFQLGLRAGQKLEKRKQKRQAKEKALQE